jgi:putative oxidoreductase
MIVAMITVHWKNGLFAAVNGVEVPLLYSSVAIGLALIGFGRYSVDAVLGIADRWSPSITLLALAVGIAGGLANAAIRRRALEDRSGLTASISHWNSLLEHADANWNR